MAKRNEKKTKGNALTQAHLQQLVLRCMIFVDRNGTVLGKGSHLFSSWLEMKYEGQGLKIKMRAQNSPYSNGSCSLKIKRGKTVLLDARGKYIAFPYDITAKTYVSGAWEKKFPVAQMWRR